MMFIIVNMDSMRLKMSFSINKMAWTTQMYVCRNGSVLMTFKESTDAEGGL